MAEITAKIEIQGVDKASPAFKSVAKNFAAASRQMQAQNLRLADSFKRIGEQNRGLIKGLKYLSIAAAGLATGAIVKTIQAGAEFGAQIADLSSITGIAGKSLDVLKAKALEFAKESVTPASQVVEAFKLVASANSDLVEDSAGLAEVTRQVLLLSNASGVGLAQSANIAVQAMNQFGAGAADANRFVNVLSAGTKVGAAELADVGEAILKTGVAARQAGLSFEQTNAAIQTLAFSGIKGSEAGTALRAIFNRLQKQTKKEFNPAIVGLDKAFENMAKRNLTAAQMMDLFGLEASAAGAILVRERKRLADWTKEVTGTNNANEQAAIRLNTFKKQVEGLGIKIQTSMIQVFDKLLPKLQPLIDRMGAFVESFDADKFAARISKGIDWIDRLVKALGGIEGVASKAAFAMEAFLAFKGIQTLLILAPALAAAAGGTASVGAAAAGAAGGVGALSSAFIGLAAAVGAISFTATFNKLRELSAQSEGWRKAIHVAGMAVAGPALGVFESAKSFKQLTMPSGPAPTGEGLQLSSDGVRDALGARLTALTQEISGQQATLKKPQQLDIRVKVDSPVPTEVTSLKTSPGLTVKASTGQMMP